MILLPSTNGQLLHVRLYLLPDMMADVLQDRLPLTITFGLLHCILSCAYMPKSRLGCCSKASTYLP